MQSPWLIKPWVIQYLFRGSWRPKGLGIITPTLPKKTREHQVPSRDPKVVMWEEESTRDPPNLNHTLCHLLDSGRR